VFAAWLRNSIFEQRQTPLCAFKRSLERGFSHIETLLTEFGFVISTLMSRSVGF